MKSKVASADNRLVLGRTATLANALTQKWRRLRKGLHEGGLEYLLYSFSSRVPRWLFRYYHTMLIRGDHVNLAAPRQDECEIRFASASDVPNLETLGINKEVALYRLERGDVCVIASRNERIVTVTWTATGRLYNRYNGSIVDIGDSGFFLFGVYTVPAQRRRGLFNACYRHQFEHRAKQGRTVKYAVIDILNKTSMKIHQRMGFQVVGETYYLSLFGISICYYTKWPQKIRKLHVFLKRLPQNLKWI